MLQATDVLDNFVLVDGLDLIENQKYEDGIVGAGDVGIMTGIAPEASVAVLAGDQPIHDLLLFAGWEGLLDGSEGGEGPIAAGHLEVFGEVLADGVEILAVLQGQQVFYVLGAIEFDGLAIHDVIILTYINQIISIILIIIIRIISISQINLPLLQLLKWDSKLSR